MSLFVVRCVDKEIDTYINTTIALYLEEIYPAEVWLRVVLSDSGEVRNFRIERDDQEIFTGSLMGLDTLVVDRSVQMNHTYTYIAYVMHDGKTYNSSFPLDVAINDSIVGQFRFLGFVDKVERRLRLYRPYLYAPAYEEGLWRINLDLLTSEWEFLGLVDTSCRVCGPVDVVVKSDDPGTMLVAFRPDPEIWPDPRNIYRTTDDGMTWTLADSGLYVQLPGTDLWGIDHPRLFLDYQVASGKVFAFSGALYESEDFGELWKYVAAFGAPPGAAAYYQDVRYHPTFPNNVWIAGGSAREEPILIKSDDYGSTWDDLLLVQHAIPFDYSIRKIAFDAEDPDIAYVATGGGLVNRTEDGGQSWTSSLMVPEGAIAYTIVSDSEVSGHLFIATDTGVAETWNEGETWTEIEFPDQIYVWDMIYDNDSKTLFLSTDGGVYQYFPFANQ